MDTSNNILRVGNESTEEVFQYLHVFTNYIQLL